jgi:choline kinase
MQAIILAGGVGSRLEKLTNGQPKCMAEIGGRPLILHQLEALADHGVGPVLMVVGYQHETIRETVGQRVEYLLNERFRETNSLYSLWLAREWIKGPFVLLNSDLFFDPEILSRVLEDPGNLLAYDSTSSRGREQTKVAIRDRRVIDLGKDLPASSARGESLGLLKFDAAGAVAMIRVADDLIRQGHERAWVIEATRALCQVLPIFGTNIAGLPWVEVDFPYDLEQARREVWPAIWKGRWRRAVYWKRTRWAALGLGAAGLAAGVYLGSTRVGPASIDWESVPPVNSPPVSLTVEDGTQNWWLATRQDSLTAEINGGGALRLEFRALLPAGHADTGRYAVAVILDGKQRELVTFTATPDPDASVPNATVADRDRLEFDLPPGHHIVRVGLLAGEGDRMLVRVRRPE